MLKNEPNNKHITKKSTHSNSEQAIKAIQQRLLQVSVA